jgi:hypothetical protein
VRWVRDLRQIVGPKYDNGVRRGTGRAPRREEHGREGGRCRRDPPRRHRTLAAGKPGHGSGPCVTTNRRSQGSCNSYRACSARKARHHTCRCDRHGGDGGGYAKGRRQGPSGTRARPGAVVPYRRPSGATTVQQRAAVQGRPCVDCGKIAPKQVADHKTPLVKEHYETGTIDSTRMRSLEAVQPQCPSCSARQGATLSRYAQTQRALLRPDD